MIVQYPEFKIIYSEHADFVLEKSDAVQRNPFMCREADTSSHRAPVRIIGEHSTHRILEASPGRRVPIDDEEES